MLFKVTRRTVVSKGKEFEKCVPFLSTQQIVLLFFVSVLSGREMQQGGLVFSNSDFSEDNVAENKAKSFDVTESFDLTDSNIKSNTS